MKNNVIGVFDSLSTSDQVVGELTGSGFSSDSVSRYEGSSSDLETQLQGAGVEADEAHEYASSVSQGGALVVVQADESRTDEAVTIMNRYYSAPSEDESGDTQTAADTTGDERLEVVEERMQVGKREVERGGVRVRSVVSEQEVEKQVTLHDETIHIDRQPVNRTAKATDDLFSEKSLELTETDEEAVVSKEARITEEVTVGKEAQERSETVSGTVRRTDVEVEVEELGAKDSRSTESKAAEPEPQADDKADEEQGGLKGAWDRIRGKG